MFSGGFWYFCPHKSTQSQIVVFTILK